MAPPLFPRPPSSGSSDSPCSQLREDIARYQALVDFLNRKLAATDGYDARKAILDDLAVAVRVLEDTEANYQRNCVRAPVPGRPFQIGPWELVSPFGIQLSEQLWLTGSVWAVHPLPGNRLLVGTEQGGLWLSEPDDSGAYKSRCLSNSWKHWGVATFVADPADPDRIFVGSNDTLGTGGPGIDGTIGGVFVGSAAKPDGEWVYVPVPGFGGVLSMIILPGERLLVVATSADLCWTPIDTVPFIWHSNAQTATDLANLTGDDFLIADRNNSTLGVAQISGSAVLFKSIGSGAIQWATATATFTPLRIASCKTKPNNVYCLGSAGPPQRLFVIRSQDSGTTWTECAYNEPNLAAPGATPAQAFASALDAFDPAVKSRYSIAVHPTDPLTVAVGYGAAALSNDGGTSQWLALNNAGATPAVPMHDDVHELTFDEATGSLLIPSDGGILILPSITAMINLPLPFGSGSFFHGDTKRNQSLPVLLMDSNPPRQSPANLAIGGGIIVAGTQDDANVWLDPTDHVWRALEVKTTGSAVVSTAGDGGVVAISSQTSGTYVLHGQNNDNVPVQWAQWRGGSWSPSQTVPVILSSTTLNSSGLIPILRPVAPTVGLLAGLPLSPVIALASPPNNVVYGAEIVAIPFVVPTKVYWTQLGVVPATWAFGRYVTENISALEAFDSASVLAGTQSGRLFRIPVGGTASEIFFDNPVSGPVSGIASDGNTVLCFNGGVAYLGQPVAAGAISRRLTRLSSFALPPNDGTRVFRGICANRNSKYSRLSFAVTVDENEVWVSNSPLGALWHKAVDGLPTAVRCSDVVFSETATEGELFLSTYGRGLWRLAF
jgi:hypothetical protein